MRCAWNPGTTGSRSESARATRRTSAPPHPPACRAGVDEGGEGDHRHEHTYMDILVLKASARTSRWVDSLLPHRGHAACPRVPHAPGVARAAVGPEWPDLRRRTRGAGRRRRAQPDAKAMLRAHPLSSIRSSHTPCAQAPPPCIDSSGPPVPCRLPTQASPPVRSIPETPVPAPAWAGPRARLPDAAGRRPRVPQATC